MKKLLLFILCFGLALPVFAQNSERIGSFVLHQVAGGPTGSRGFNIQELYRPGIHRTISIRRNPHVPTHYHIYGWLWASRGAAGVAAILNSTVS